MQSNDLVKAKSAKVSCCNIDFENYACKVLVPDVYMNISGSEIAKYMRYFSITPQQLLVVYDDMDFQPGVVRFKIGGGLGGHNGLKSLKTHLSSDDFMRLRLGIGHPGLKQEVSNYVLSRPSVVDKERIIAAINLAKLHLSEILLGDFQTAMLNLHSHR